MDIVTVVTELAKLSAFVLPIVFGLVTLYGKFGVTGKWQLASSLVTGLVLGGGLGYLQLTALTSASATVANATVGNAIASTLYGLIVGLTASGVYEAGKTAVAKGTEIALNKREVG